MSSRMGADQKYVKYGYDPRYQLKSENKWSAKVPGTRSYQYLYDYDPNGNRLAMFHNGVKVAYVYGDNNELTNAGGTSWDYDHFGNTVAIGGTSIAYDFESHALTVSASGSGTDTHEYDGDGRRMRSRLNGSSVWNHFVHDELTENILLEYQAPVNPNAKSLYTWGIGLISSTQIGASLSAKRWFHFDGLGSTRALTDFDENITDTYEFSAFGALESSTGSSVNPFRYVGQWGYYDDGARGSQYGLLLLGVRYYERNVGTFLTWDPVPYSNPYWYCNNNAPNGIDPSGMFPVWLCRILCAFVCVGSAGTQCLQCLDLCEKAKELDEFRKILDKLFANRPKWKNPKRTGDCLLVPGYGGVFQSNCRQCCNRLEPDDTSHLRTYCECMCDYVRRVYKPAPKEVRDKPEVEPCGPEPTGGGTCD